MKIYSGYRDLKETLSHPVVTIGNFDGVHLGHREIIREAKRRAEKRNGVVVAYTFKPHPQIALHPDAKVPLLSTYQERLELLEEAGVDCVIEEPFSREFSTMRAEEFFSEVLIHHLGANEIVVGYDFAFGKGRTGHIDALRKFCESAQIELFVVPPHRVEEDVVSSTRIRKALFSGDMEEARHLLGYPFFYQGVVVRGEGRGRKLGFPTANLKLEEKLELPHGVYVAEVDFEGKRFPGVTNVGVRPTFNTEEDPDSRFSVLVETHLLDQDLNLYGSTLKVSFLKRLREERKFSGVEALKDQIAKDLSETRKFFQSKS